MGADVQTEAGRRLLAAIRRDVHWFIGGSQDVEQALVAEIEIAARRDTLARYDAVKAAIEAELEMVGPEPPDPFVAGTAAAYNYVLSHWPPDSLQALSGPQETDIHPDDPHRYSKLLRRNARAAEL